MDKITLMLSCYDGGLYGNMASFSIKTYCDAGICFDWGDGETDIVEVTGDQWKHRIEHVYNNAYRNSKATVMVTITSDKAEIVGFSNGRIGMHVHEIDCHEATSLKVLAVHRSPSFDIVNIRGCDKLERLYCEQLECKSLDLGFQRSLRSLSCIMVDMETLNIVGCPFIEVLEICNRRSMNLELADDSRLREVIISDYDDVTPNSMAQIKSLLHKNRGRIILKRNGVVISITEF